MKAYKGFDKDLKCLGFQYEVGKTYEEPEASLCNKGFHACENPLDALNYYSLLDDNGVNNRFGEVELEEISDETSDDSKRVGKKIEIKSELNLKGLIKVGVDFLFESNTAKKVTKKVASNKFSKLAASGYGSLLAASGNCSQLAASGDGSQLAASGDRSQLAASGNCSQLAASGDGSLLAASGDGSLLAASGDRSQLAASGDRSKLAASGYGSLLAASGDGSVVMNAGIKGKAKAAKGCWITLAEWKYNEKWSVVAVVTKQVDDEEIKADTWYQLVDGKFQEASE